jgi:signal transduction histidine kinase
MEQASWWLMDIIGPAVLLIVLICLVIRARSNRDTGSNQRAEQGARDVYRQEEERRRDGTDEL